MKYKGRELDMPDLEQLQNERSRCRYQNRYRRKLWSTVSVFAVVAAISILITMLLMPVYRIYGSSMEPTLASGQIVLAIKGNHYQKGDLVVFYYGNKLLIKRVVAGPEDVVEIKKNGDVYINGTLLKEPYVSVKSFGDSDTEYPIRVMEEHWFLLGDNRENSIDSRNELIGCVSREQIVGKIVLRIWPLNQMQIFKNKTENGI